MTRLRNKKGIPRSPMKRGKKRSTSEAERIYGPAPFRDWLHKQPCVVLGVPLYIVQAHVKNGGMGRKAGYEWSVPMNDALHHELHQHGIATFEAKYDIDLELAAIATQERWRAHLIIDALHTTDPLCARCKASFREDGSVFCGSCQELNRQERPERARKRPPRDAA